MLAEKTRLPKDLAATIASVQSRITTAAQKHGPGSIPCVGHVINHIVRGVMPPEDSPWYLAVHDASVDDFERLVNTGAVPGFQPHVRVVREGDGPTARRFDTIIAGKGRHLRQVMLNFRDHVVRTAIGHDVDLKTFIGLRACAEKIAAQRPL